MSLTIYHNPHCSKSRKTLELIQESGIDPAIVEYLNEPLAADELLRLSRMLGMPVEALMRKSDREFMEATDLPPLSDDEALAAWLQQHPIALQRPIVVDESTQRAIVGRPPENVTGLLDR